MRQTTNYGLKMPEGSDTVNIDDLNYNTGIIDQKLKDVENKTSNIKVPVESVNGKTGKVELKAVDIKTGDGITVESHLADVTKIIGNVNDVSLPLELKGKSLQEQNKVLFQSASDGKTKIASAITGKGQSARASDSWDTLDAKIRAIETGHKFIYGYSNVVKSNTTGQKISKYNDLDINVSAYKYYNNNLYYIDYHKNLCCFDVTRGQIIFKVLTDSDYSYMQYEEILINNNCIYIIIRDYNANKFALLKHDLKGAFISKTIDILANYMTAHNDYIYAYKLDDRKINQYDERFNLIKTIYTDSKKGYCRFDMGVLKIIKNNMYFIHCIYSEYGSAKCDFTFLKFDLSSNEPRLSFENFKESTFCDHGKIVNILPNDNFVIQGNVYGDDFIKMHNSYLSDTLLEITENDDVSRIDYKCIVCNNCAYYYYFDNKLKITFLDKSLNSVEIREKAKPLAVIPEKNVLITTIGTFHASDLYTFLN